MAEREKLSIAKVNLEELYKMAPFPSQANVELENQNQATLQAALGDLLSALALHQVEPAELKQPTVFMESFWQANRDMVNHAKTLGVTLPKDFGFGLDAYLQGKPPKPDNVPRLMQQLAIIKSLSDLLFAARINSIEAIGREVFEVEDSEAPVDAAAEPAARSSGRRRAAEAAADPNAGVAMVNPESGLLKPGDLFSTMKFTIVFKAKESNALQVINALAGHDMFMVLKRVTWMAPRDQVAVRKLVIGADATGKETEAAVNKENRVVSGRESILTVRLDLDVYRFTRKAE